MKHILKLKITFYVLAFSLIIISCNNNNSGTNNNPKDSLAILTEQIHKNPHDALLFSKRAKLYFSNKKLNEAIIDAEFAVKIDSLKTQYYVQLCEYYILAAKSEKAKDILLKCNKLVPDNIDILLKLSELYLFVKQYDESMNYLQMAQEVDKQVPRIYFLRGIIFKEKGDTAKAINNFQITVDKDPQYYDAYVMLGLLYYRKQDSLAIDYYKAAINLKPKSIEAHYGLAMFYQENKKEKNAIDEYNLIINTIDSTYIFAWYNIGYVNLEYLKNYKEAIKYFTKTLQIDSTYIEAYYNRGYCYEKLHDFKKAKEAYMKCKQIIPNYELAVKGLNRLDRE